MLARVTGTLESLAGNTALIAPSGQDGLAYEVLVPGYLVERLAGLHGEEVALVTLQYLESVNQGSSFIPRLLGFATVQEREFFELLTTVKGLGNKRALRAMAVEPGVIARAVAERNPRFLQSLPEIGPKLADLIVHELKSKVDAFAHMGTGQAAAADPPATSSPPASSAPPARAAVEAKPARKRAASAHGVKPSGSGGTPPTAPRPPIRETVDALIALGESPVDAERMVARAMDKARASGDTLPVLPGDLLALAYAAR